MGFTSQGQEAHQEDWEEVSLTGVGAPICICEVYNYLYGYDKEGTRAFLEKRPPRFQER